MAYYKDLREYIEVLEKNNLLWRIKSPIKKETELMPLVRWQFRGLSEDQRRAFLFENVTDQKGTKFDVPVLVGALAASTKIYALGMMCKEDEIVEKWDKAQLNPIPAKLVKTGACQEEVHTGKELKEKGLEEFPIEADTPGFDGLVRTTATNFFSKDPETGAINIGNYSGHVHARDRMTVGLGVSQHMAIHLRKSKDMGKPLPAALVVGVIPAINYVSVAKVPYGIDELAVAGGLAGEPIEVVKCKTVPLEVPANSEIVIEGEISITAMEEHTGSFGEYCGYMAEGHPSPIFNISCITHRKKPIYSAIISQMPPSESSKIRQIAYNNSLYKFLKHDCGIAGIQKVWYHESSGSWQYCVIQMKKYHPADAWQALYGALGFATNVGKIIIAVDEDIDPADPDSVNWALSFRMQPLRDVRLLGGKVATLDPSTAPTGLPHAERAYPQPTGASAMLIDATRKWPYTPVALPRKEYMENARKIWEAEGLPPLKPRIPWFGYELGYWPEEYRVAAEYNVRGEILKLGEKTGRELKEFHI